MGGLQIKVKKSEEWYVPYVSVNGQGSVAENREYREKMCD